MTPAQAEAKAREWHRSINDKKQRNGQRMIELNKWDRDSLSDLLLAAAEKAAENEREACAKVADHHAEICIPVQNETVQCAPCIAAAIRARGKK